LTGFAKHRLEEISATPGREADTFSPSDIDRNAQAFLLPGYAFAEVK
jgi:hypothetical protein